MIRSVEHIGIAVRSIEEARGFYESLGLAIEHIEEVPEEGVRVAFMPCGHTRLELLEPTRPDSPVAKFLEKRGPGIHHVCLESDAIDDDDAPAARARESSCCASVRPSAPAARGSSSCTPSRAAASCSSCRSRARNRPTRRKERAGARDDRARKPGSGSSVEPRRAVLGRARGPVAGRVTFRGLNVGSFDDFLAQAATGDEVLLGFSTIFVPMFRVERIYLDEQVGMVLSYRQRFEGRVGRSVEAYLARPGDGDDTPPS